MHRARAQVVQLVLDALAGSLRVLEGRELAGALDRYALQMVRAVARTVDPRADMRFDLGESGHSCETGRCACACVAVWCGRCAGGAWAVSGAYRLRLSADRNFDMALNTNLDRTQSGPPNSKTVKYPFDRMRGVPKILKPSQYPFVRTRGVPQILKPSQYPFVRTRGVPPKF
jgi:hypothetical protein